MLVLSLFSSLQAVSAEPVTLAYDYEITDGYGYDLTTGKYKEDVTLSTTDKMLISPSVVGNELQLTNTNFHHLLFFDKYNRYIGYINGNGTTYENSKHLGYDATALTVYPENAKSFAIVNYNYDVIRDSVVIDNTENIAKIDLPMAGLLTVKPDKNIFDGVLTDDTVSTTTGEYLIGTHAYTTSGNYIPLLPSTQYTISNNQGASLDSLYIFYYDDNYNFISENHANARNPHTFTVPSNVEYMYFVYVDAYIPDALIQLELGSNATTYEKYVTDADWATYQTLTYRDVFGDSLYGTGKTNFVNNGDNNDIDSNFSTRANTVTTINNSVLEIEATTNGSSVGIQYSRSLTDIYYFNFEAYSNDLDSIRLSVGEVEQSITTQKTSYSLSIFHDTDGAFRIYADMLEGETFYIDSILYYNTTDLIGYGLEPDAEQMDEWLDFYKSYIDAPATVTYNDIFESNLYLPYIDDIVPYNAGIDAEAWEGLTYRDIFGDSLFGTGKTNLIENGDFTQPLDSNYYNSSYTFYDSIVDEKWFLSSDGSLNQVAPIIYHDYAGVNFVQNNTYYLYIEVEGINIDKLQYQLYDTNTFIFNEVYLPYDASNTYKYYWENDYITTNTRNRLRTIFTTVDSNNYVNYDNFMIFELSTLFEGKTLPTETQFTELLEQYKILYEYKDVSGVALGFGYVSNVNANAFAVNGSYEADFPSRFALEYETDNNILYYAQGDYNADDIIYTYMTYYNPDQLITEDPPVNNALATLKYDTFTAAETRENLLHTFIPSGADATSGAYEVQTLATTYQLDKDYESISTPYIEITNNGLQGTVYIIDYQYINITDVFSSYLEPTPELMQEYYSVWVDPVVNSTNELHSDVYKQAYTVYYDTASLEALTIAYTLDAGDPVEPDVNTGVDNLLDNINMNNEGGKRGIAIIVIIGVVIISGFISKNPTVIIITGLTTFGLFAAFGWVPLWIVTVTLLGLSIFGFMKLKGGS